MARSSDSPVLHALPGADAAGAEARSDDELMLLARGGKEEAFDQLVRRHQQRVLAVAVKSLGDPSLARDVAQDAFLELYRYRQRYRPQGRFTAFLYRLVVNRCRMSARAHAAELRRREAWQREPEGAPGAASDELLLQQERRRDVERGLRTLSPKLREVMVLRYAADLSLDEVAACLELPVGTVKSRLFAGMEKLRQALEEVA